MTSEIKLTFLDRLENLAEASSQEEHFRVLFLFLSLVLCNDCCSADEMSRSNVRDKMLRSRVEWALVVSASHFPVTKPSPVFGSV